MLLVFQSPGKHRQRIAHRQINQGGRRSQFDHRAGVLSFDVIGLGELCDSDHATDGRVFEHGNEVVGDRRNHMACGLWDQDAANCLCGCHSQRQCGFHLTSGKVLETSPIDFSLTGRIVECQRKHGGWKTAEAPLSLSG